jgi:uncharacterized membrane protein YhaH (DUF805 family)
MDFAKLWNNFLDTVTNHYFDTKGRVGRPQFWYFILVQFLIAVVLAIIQSVILHNILTTLFSLAMLLPNLGMAVRRLQDTGRSGTLAWGTFAVSAAVQIVTLLGIIVLPLLIILSPILLLLSIGLLIAAIALIYFCAQPGQPEANAFGPVPPVFAPN